MKQCKKCGATLDDQVRFCPKCGTPQANADSTIATPKPQVVIRKRKKCSLMMLAIPVVVLILLLVGLQVIKSNRKVTLDITDYAKINVQGMNGYGTAESAFHEGAFLKDLVIGLAKNGQIDKKWKTLIGEVPADDPSYVLQLLYSDPKATEAVQLVRRSVNSVLDKTDHLSNGDTIIQTFTYDNTVLKDIHVKLDGNTYKEQAEGLEAVPTFDAFADLDASAWLSVSGYSGFGKLKINEAYMLDNDKYDEDYDDDEYPMYGDGSLYDEAMGLRYTVEETKNLKNGDRVMVKVEPTEYDEFGEAYLYRYGKLPESDTLTVEISGLKEVKEYDPLKDIEKKISFKGYNGYGKAFIEEDEENGISYQLSKDSMLSNDDEIEITATPNDTDEFNDTYAQKYGKTVSNTSAAVKVKGLANVDAFDPFKDIEDRVSFSGYDGYGKAKVEDDEKHGIKYQLSKRKKLSNDSEIEISVVPLDEDILAFDDTYIEKYGKTIDASTQKMKVSGLKAVKDFDPFSKLEVATTGYNGYAKVKLSGVDASTGINFVTDKSGSLSNGDTVTVYARAEGGDEFGDEYIGKYGLNITKTSESYAIADLQEVPTFDPFENVEISFSGTAPDGQATISTKDSDYGVSYALSKTSGLSNGDEIKITVKPANYADFDDAYVDTYDALPNSMTKKVTVSGLSEYISKFEQIPEDKLNTMKNVFKTWWSSTERNGNYEFFYEKYKGKIKYLGGYVLKSKDHTNEVQNYVYLIYHEVITPVEKDTGYPTVDRYLYIRFNNVLLKSSGSCIVDTDNYYVSTDDGGEYFRVSYGSTWSDFWGYNTLDSLIYNIADMQEDSFTIDAALESSETEPTTEGETE